MKYCIPDLPEEDYKAVGEIIFSPYPCKVKVRTHVLPSGKKLKVTYTTMRTGFEVVDDWDIGYLADLSDLDYNYIKDNFLFEPIEDQISYEILLPSGKIIRFSL